MGKLTRRKSHPDDPIFHEGYSVGTIRKRRPTPQAVVKTTDTDTVTKKPTPTKEENND